MRILRGIGGLFRDRWQLPAAAIAIALAWLAVSLMKPAEREVNFESLLAGVMELMQSEKYYDAANAAANLLEFQPPLRDSQKAILHDRIAEIAYRVEQEREAPISDNVKLILEHQSAAEEMGLRPDARAALRAGQAHEWLNEPREAIESYDRALEREPTSSVRRQALQALVKLLAGRPHAEERRREIIDRLLAEDGVSPAFIWWALQHAVQEAIDHNEPQRARHMLERHAERFKRSDLKGYHDFLWAGLEISEGKFEEGAPEIDWVDEWLKEHTKVDAELDRAGFLPALNLWLRSLTHLADERPQQALDCLDRVLTMQWQGPLFVDTTVARARALAMLERHAAARREIRDGLARVSRDAAARSAAAPRMRKAMLGLSQRRQDLGDPPNAVEYLSLALDLTPESEHESRLELLTRIGAGCEEAAAIAADEQARRDYRALSADAMSRAGDLSGMDPIRQANLRWAAAQAYDEAGIVDKARGQLRAFIETTASDARIPSGLLQLGQTFAAEGEFEQAQVWYRRLIENFPEIEEASRAMVLRADALMMLGEKRYDEAATLLEQLLSSGRVSPDNQNFKDALFMICDLLYEQGKYAAAIARMEEFIQLCADHPELPTIRYMLADAYRRSAHLLRESSASGDQLVAVRAERDARFRRAAELFGELMADESPDAGAGGQVSEVQSRHVLFSRAECLYELNTDESLSESLSLYRQASATYQGRPAALTAQVQIANILLRQGKLTEAARAVERARWLLRTIPDGAFAEDAESGAELDRTHWDRQLTAIATSHLLRDAFGDTR